MEKELWHSSFNPQKFLSKTNLDSLIEHNKVFNECNITHSTKPCFLCSKIQYPGILLNDKSYLCKNCLLEVSAIRYPNKYETLNRSYLLAKESRRIAFEEFTKQHGYSKKDNTIFVIALFSLLLLFFHTNFLIVPTSLFILSIIIYLVQDRKLKIWNKQREDWEKNYPEPIQPTLRHFHDPQAELNLRDNKILKIFNNWPGYPPFWNYLKEVVHNRDGNRCQVTGCPSRVSIHVHHKKSVSKGGEHVPDNLITLCDFHHALEPDEGHERIWGVIKTRYFTLVREHTRSNRSSDGFHHVRPHIRRLELINIDELKKLYSTYGFKCPTCSSSKLKFTIYSKQNEIKILCNSCGMVWEGKQQLTEETGPKIAEILDSTQNIGHWKSRWDMLSSRTGNTFKSLSSKSIKKKKKVTIRKTKGKPNCPLCGSPMKLIKPSANQDWNPFWGCIKYNATGCRGSRNA